MTSCQCHAQSPTKKRLVNLVLAPNKSAINSEYDNYLCGLFITIISATHVTLNESDASESIT